MTQTADPDTVNMPAKVHDEAVELVRDLAAAAGDPSEVYARLRQTCQDAGNTTDALGSLAAALVVTFAECITHPTAPGEFAEVNLPDLIDEEYSHE